MSSVSHLTLARCSLLLPKRSSLLAFNTIYMLTSLKGVSPVLMSSLNSSLMYPPAHLPWPHIVSNQHLKVSMSRADLWGTDTERPSPVAVTPPQLSTTSSSSLLRPKPLEAPMSKLGCVHVCSVAQSWPTQFQFEYVSRIRQLLTTTALITLVWLSSSLRWVVAIISPQVFLHLSQLPGHPCLASC